MPFGCILEHGTPLGSILANLLISVIFGASPAWKSSPILTPFLFFWRHFGDRFFVAFLATSFSNILQFRGPFWVQFGSLFGLPGNLGNGFKTLNGVRFSHFGGPFCKHDFQARFSEWLFCDFYTLETIFASMISRLDLMSDLLSIFDIFEIFWTPFWGVFWENTHGNGGGKKSRK